MDWSGYHKQSEQLAGQAHEALRLGDKQNALDAFAAAAVAEQAALAALDESKPRTLGIIAVSAVSLLFKATRFEEAIKLAHRYLGSSVLLDGAREQLDDLVITLYNERDKARMQGQFLPGSVTVAVKGGDVLRGAAPLELIVEKVKTLQSIFMRVVEWKSDRPLRRRGPPTRDISSIFEPWLVQEPPGSFQFSVAVKVNGQIDMFTSEQLQGADIAQAFLDIVSTVTSDLTGEATRDLIGDVGYRNTFRKLVRNLTPPSGSNEAMTITSKDRVDAVAQIDETTRSKLDAVGRSDQPVMALLGELQHQEYVGTLRALDLDADWLKIEVEPDGRTVTVKELSQAVDDVIGPMVNKRVKVIVGVRPGKSPAFVDIELATRS